MFTCTECQSSVVVVADHFSAQPYLFNFQKNCQLQSRQVLWRATMRVKRRRKARSLMVMLRIVILKWRRITILLLPRVKSKPDFLLKRIIRIDKSEGLEENQIINMKVHVFTL